MIKKIFLQTAFAIQALLAFVYLQGCENPVTDNFEVSIKGALYGLYNYPYQGVKVTCGDKIATTDIYGYFSLSGAKGPSPVNIIDTTNKVYIYIVPLNVFSSKKLSINYTSDFSSSNFCNIAIGYTDSSQNTFARCVFTDFNNFTFYDEPINNPGMISFPVPPGISYTGSVIVITFMKDENNHIIFYRKYSEKKNVTVSAGQNISLNFMSGDFKAVPLNIVSSIKFTPLAGQDVYQRFSTIVFGRMTKNYSSIMNFETFNSDLIEVVGPSFQYFGANTVVGFVSGGTQSYSSVYAPMTSTDNLTAPAAPVLVSPIDNSSVDVNTEIVFNQGLDKVSYKYYKLTLIDTLTHSGYSHPRYEVYLDKEHFSLSELEAMGAGSLKGRIFRWNVEIYDSRDLLESLYEYANYPRKIMSGSEYRTLKVNL